MLMKLAKFNWKFTLTGDRVARRGYGVVSTHAESNQVSHLTDGEVVEINYPSEYRVRPVTLRYTHRSLDAMEQTRHETVSLSNGLFCDNAVQRLLHETRGPLYFAFGAFFGMLLFAVGTGRYFKKLFSFLSAILVSLGDVLRNRVFFRSEQSPGLESFEFPAAATPAPIDASRLTKEAPEMITLLSKEEEENLLEDVKKDQLETHISLNIDTEKLTNNKGERTELSCFGSSSDLEDDHSVTVLDNEAENEMEEQCHRQSELLVTESVSVGEEAFVKTVDPIKVDITEATVDEELNATEESLTIETDTESAENSQDSDSETKDIQEHIEVSITQDQDVVTDALDDSNVHIELRLEDPAFSANTKDAIKGAVELQSIILERTERSGFLNNSIEESITEGDTDAVYDEISEAKEAAILPVLVSTAQKDIERVNADLETDIISESSVSGRQEAQNLGALIISESYRQRSSHLRKELESALSVEDEQIDEVVSELVKSLEEMESINTLSESQALLFLWGSWELVYTTDSISKRVLNALKATELLDEFQLQVNFDAETKHIYSKIWLKVNALEDLLQIPSEVHIRTSVESTIEAEGDLHKGLQLYVPQILTTVDFSEMKLPDRVQVLNFNLETKQVQELWSRLVTSASISLKGASSVTRFLETLLPESVLYLIKTRAQQRLRVTYLDNQLCILRDEDSVSVLKKLHSPADC
eukprot:g5747.t1